uniref:Putative secreted peptide n=1 Tax=Anopheles braziliensis TaxID=58242 RepID=A0A2M3ZUV6_9DIPT
MIVVIVCCVRQSVPFVIALSCPRRCLFRVFPRNQKSRSVGISLGLPFGSPLPQPPTPLSLPRFWLSAQLRNGSKKGGNPGKREVQVSARRWSRVVNPFTQCLLSVRSASRQ